MLYRQDCDVPKRAAAFASFGRHPNSRERAFEEVCHALEVGIWFEFALGFGSVESQHESLTLHLRRLARDKVFPIQARPACHRPSDG